MASESVNSRVKRLQRERAEVEVDIAKLRSRLKGLGAEIDSLERLDVSTAEDLAAMRRTDAIVEVLRSSGGELAPRAILEALHARGRTDKLNEVTATLSHLVKGDRVRKDVGARAYYAS